MQILSTRALIGALTVCAGAGALFAQPTNTSLPGGWSWAPIGGGSYDTGTLGTSVGGNDGQTAGPYSDTSFGVMNELDSPWYTGTDLDSQQYIQRQVFGDFGNPSAFPSPGSPGFRYANPGYIGPLGPTIGSSVPTGAGGNFPYTAAERRTITANHWNNPFPDAGGVAALGQVVYVPVAATLTAGVGWGGDEMLLKVIGGIGGQQSRFRVDANLDASWVTTDFGGITNTNNRINVNGITTVFDAGALGSFDVPWGYNVGLAAGQIDLFRDDSSNFLLDQGTNVGDPGAGLTPNSVGFSVSDAYNVLSSISQNGSSFSIDFSAAAELFIERQFGNADARAQLGPGMQGVLRLVVEWQAFRAVPTPGTAGLMLVAAGFIVRRRRA
jgi:hypothetical protein